MTDARIRTLLPLLLALHRGLSGRLRRHAVADARRARCRTEQIVNDPAEGLPGRTRGPGDAARGTRGAGAGGRAAARRPVAYGDVIVRIRSKLSLPQAEHQRVDREIEWLQRNPDYLARVFGRAQRYLHHVANEVEARGLPGDLALLPVVESAFNPFAYSRTHASGLWQFIAPTGERYGLQPQLLAGPAARRARVHPRRARIPRAPRRPLRRRLVPRDRRVQLRLRQHPARDQPQQRARPQDRFLLAVAARRRRAPTCRSWSRSRR